LYIGEPGFERGWQMINSTYLSGLLLFDLVLAVDFEKHVVAYRALMRQIKPTVSLGPDDEICILMSQALNEAVE